MVLLTLLGPHGCHSVVACAWLIMYHGVPTGSLEGVLDVKTNEDLDFLPRMFFDLSFFVIVGIILFNVITGLMVDTFSSLREEAAVCSTGFVITRACSGPQRALWQHTLWHRSTRACSLFL